MDFIYSVFPFLSPDKPIITWIFLISILLLVGALVKMLFRVAIVIVVVAAIAVFVGGYSPGQVLEKGQEVIAISKSYIQEKALPLIKDGLDSTKVEKKEDGTYLLKGAGFSVSGTSADKFTVHIDSLNKDITREELNKYLSAEQINELVQKIDAAMKI